MTKLIPQQEIAFRDKQKAMEVMKQLVEEDYVVMLSKEENLYVVNYVWSPLSDRNNTVFMDKEVFDVSFTGKEKHE